MKRFCLVALLLVSLMAPNKALAATSPDTDNDGLTDADELSLYRTDPNNADTDNDGFKDGLEVKNGYSPHLAQKKMFEVDTDGDGVNDAVEITAKTNLTKPDSDGDGIPDIVEIKNSFDPTSTSTARLEKKIVVSIKTQTLSYYLGDQKLGEFKVSTGVKGWDTPKGQFKIDRKLPVHVYGYKGGPFYYPNTKWNLRFAVVKGGGLYIHGAYWHNNFGKKMSHGCVNVSYKDMAGLYEWADVGTKVIIE
ncbi:MAG: ErfK/YbiS/YcfS/YnhG family protein [Candidatus Magasanikbacteria bacterium]|nr:ErfK/YbiS/YcfS/YnhG family protein [Candidatus Magasanikbacteria bacterium]